MFTDGSEVWGFENNDALEHIQLMYCKYILGLKKSTTSSLPYKELGRHSTDIRIKSNIKSYRSRIVTNQKNYKLTSLMYKTLTMSTSYQEQFEVTVVSQC